MFINLFSTYKVILLKYWGDIFKRQMGLYKKNIYLKNSCVLMNKDTQVSTSKVAFCLGFF